MQYDFDSLIERRNTASTKWNKYKSNDVIPLWIADMDFAAPPAVVRAMQNRLEHGVFGYSNAPEQLASAIVDYCGNTFNWQIQPEWIVWTPGLVPALTASCRAVGVAGDQVLIPTPVYYPFLSVPTTAGREAVLVSLSLKSRWQLDFTALEAAVTERTSMLMLCNPHNPVGRVYDADELLDLAQFCHRHNLMLCSDEIHCDLILDAQCKHIPIASLSADVAARTITLMAASKTYNLAGLYCGFAIISNSELRRAFKRQMQNNMPGISPISYAASLAAYTECEDWRQQLLGYLRGNLELLHNELMAIPGLSLAKLEATYLAWIDVRDLGLADPVKFFELAGVGLSDGADFGLPGFLRLNFACQRALLKQALDRIRDAVKNKPQL